MGELILCSRPLAALPYYMEDISLNVYSMEELCYYLEQNISLLEKDFMNEELIGWIRKELGIGELADKLQDIYRAKGKLSKFVECILVETAYTPAERIRDMVQSLEEMDGQSPFVCKKIRADRYMQAKRYVNALYEYRELLRVSDRKKEDSVMWGNILHNMGTAYARLFLFREAADCFEEAYGMNGNRASLLACLYAYRCRRDSDGFYRKAADYGIEGNELDEANQYLDRVSRDEAVAAFEQKLDAPENRETLAGIVDTWKTEYRKNS